MSELVRILIVDDHQMFIDGIKSLIKSEERFQVVAEELSGEAGLDRIRQGDIDLLITDISMGEMSGVDLTKIVKEERPEVKVLVLSMHNDREVVSEIMMSEAEGFILKNTGKQELISAITQIVDDGTFYSKEVLSIMMERVKKEKKVEEEIKELSEREMEVLNLICEEFSSEAIAEKLFISRRTVDTHRNHIFEKTGCKTLVGLIKFAIRNELVSA